MHTDQILLLWFSQLIINWENNLNAIKISVNIFFSEMFYGFAPGLVDMMEYTSRDIDQSVTENLRVASRAFIAADATR